MQCKFQQAFPELGWELGPGSQKRNFLAFTLNGDPTNLELVSEILKRAPTITRWEFRAGRPRRAYSGQLVFRNEFGQQITISLQDWRYVLTEFDNGQFFDIDISTKQKLRLDSRAKQQVLKTAVQLALGELQTLRYIDRIEFVEEPIKEWYARSTPFEYLAEHIDSLTAPQGT
ncbi:MAG TPA: hypothetical protein DDY91_07830 [Planctomycetaceae bacterium]|nr:hypothetical protein [Planctomycetaceae bacterium]